MKKIAEDIRLANYIEKRDSEIAKGYCSHLNRGVNDAVAQAAESCETQGVNWNPHGKRRD
jgi:hypothetical protein